MRGHRTRAWVFTIAAALSSVVATSHIYLVQSRGMDPITGILIGLEITQAVLFAVIAKWAWQVVRRERAVR